MHGHKRMSLSNYSINCKVMVHMSNASDWLSWGDHVQLMRCYSPGTNQLVIICAWWPVFDSWNGDSKKCGNYINFYLLFFLFCFCFVFLWNSETDCARCSATHNLQKVIDSLDLWAPRKRGKEREREIMMIRSIELYTSYQFSGEWPHFNATGV